ncbi:MAG: hypothetical protein AABX48_03300 [Nanoarchaeota archaeon]
MELVALLSSKDKESWPQVAGLIKHGEWEKIFIVGDDEAKSFSSDKKFEFIKVNFDQRIKDLRDDLIKKLKGKFDELEVGLSIASGSGKEHMALISALINIPIGIRFAALTKEGIVDL